MITAPTRYVKIELKRRTGTNTWETNWQDITKYFLEFGSDISFELDARTSEVSLEQLNVSLIMDNSRGKFNTEDSSNSMFTTGNYRLFARVKVSVGLSQSETNGVQDAPSDLFVFDGILVDVTIALDNTMTLLVASKLSVLKNHILDVDRSVSINPQYSGRALLDKIIALYNSTYSALGVSLKLGGIYADYVKSEYDIVGKTYYELLVSIASELQLFLSLYTDDVIRIGQRGMVDSAASMLDPSTYRIDGVNGVALSITKPTYTYSSNIATTTYPFQESLILSQATLETIGDTSPNSIDSNITYSSVFDSSFQSSPFGSWRGRVHHSFSFFNTETSYSTYNMSSVGSIIVVDMLMCISKYFEAKGDSGTYYTETHSKSDYYPTVNGVGKYPEYRSTNMNISSANSPECSIFSIISNSINTDSSYNIDYTYISNFLSAYIGKSIGYYNQAIKFAYKLGIVKTIPKKNFDGTKRFSNMGYDSICVNNEGKLYYRRYSNSLLRRGMYYSIGDRCFAYMHYARNNGSGRFLMRTKLVELECTTAGTTATGSNSITAWGVGSYNKADCATGTSYADGSAMFKKINDCFQVDSTHVDDVQMTHVGFSEYSRILSYTNEPYYIFSGGQFPDTYDFIRMFDVRLHGGIYYIDYYKVWGLNNADFSLQGITAADLLDCRINGSVYQNATNACVEFEFLLPYDTDLWESLVHPRGSTVICDVEIGEVPVDASLSHLRLVFDGTNNTIQAFVNGSAFDTKYNENIGKSFTDVDIRAVTFSGGSFRSLYSNLYADYLYEDDWIGEHLLTETFKIAYKNFTPKYGQVLINICDSVPDSSDSIDIFNQLFKSEMSSGAQTIYYTSKESDILEYVSGIDDVRNYVTIAQSKEQYICEFLYPIIMGTPYINDIIIYANERIIYQLKSMRYYVGTANDVLDINGTLTNSSVYTGWIVGDSANSDKTALELFNGSYTLKEAYGTGDVENQPKLTIYNKVIAGLTYKVYKFYTSDSAWDKLKVSIRLVDSQNQLEKRFYTDIDGLDYVDIQSIKGVPFYKSSAFLASQTDTASVLKYGVIPETIGKDKKYTTSMANAVAANFLNNRAEPSARVTIQVPFNYQNPKPYDQVTLKVYDNNNGQHSWDPYAGNGVFNSWDSATDSGNGLKYYYKVFRIFGVTHKADMSGTVLKLVEEQGA
jgi:hypothetical protein